MTLYIAINFRPKDSDNIETELTQEQIEHDKQTCLDDGINFTKYKNLFFEMFLKDYTYKNLLKNVFSNGTHVFEGDPNLIEYAYSFDYDSLNDYSDEPDKLYSEIEKYLKQISYKFTDIDDSGYIDHGDFKYSHAYVSFFIDF